MSKNFSDELRKQMALDESEDSDETTETSEPIVISRLKQQIDETTQQPTEVLELSTPEELVLTEEPAMIEEPAVIEEHVEALELAASESPVATEEPAMIEEHVEALEFAASEAPVATEEPEPATIEEPAMIEEQVEALEFAASEAPVATEEPTMIEEHVEALELAASEAPAVIEEQVLIEETTFSEITEIPPFVEPDLEIEPNLEETPAFELSASPSILTSPSVSPSTVTLIHDPYHIQTYDIARSQDEQEDELEDEELLQDEQLDEIELTDSSQLEPKTENQEELSTEPLTEQTEENTALKLLEEIKQELAQDTLTGQDSFGLQDAQAASLEMTALASAIAQEEHVRQMELEGLMAEQAKADAERLAAQIAEDEALEREQAEAERDPMAFINNDPEVRAAMPWEPEEDEDGNLDLRELQSCIEALLFMSDKPLSTEKLQELLGPEMPLDYFDQAMEKLISRYQTNFHGFELVQVAGGYQFRTKPGRAALAKKLAKVITQKLSTGAMETLAIVAYKQPVLKDDVDKVRGVDSSHFIRGLLDKKLIKISGRSELPGRPMLYATTQDFLEVFGLGALDDMPALREIESMIPTSQGGTDGEDPRVKQMRELVHEMKSDTSTTLIYDPKQDEDFLTDIRNKVNAIPTSTPYIDEQKALEKAAKDSQKEAAKEAARLRAMEELGELGAQSVE